MDDLSCYIFHIGLEMQFLSSWIEQKRKIFQGLRPLTPWGLTVPPHPQLINSRTSYHHNHTPGYAAVCKEAVLIEGLLIEAGELLEDLRYANAGFIIVLFTLEEIIYYIYYYMTTHDS